MATAVFGRRDTRRAGPAMTRFLLGCGVIAGPFYVVVSLAQALTRDGFDVTRHAWSLLANGGLGWLQVVNLVVAGAMTLAFSVGLARVLPELRWAPRLVGGYGASLVAAGVFRADPAYGFPAGAPADAGDVSWHGVVHLAAGAVGFVSLVVACLLIGRHFARQRARWWALASRVTGVAFLAAFVGIASGAGTVATTIGFVVAVTGVSVWMSAVASGLYRTVH